MGSGAHPALWSVHSGTLFMGASGEADYSYPHSIAKNEWSSTSTPYMPSF